MTSGERWLPKMAATGKCPKCGKVAIRPTVCVVETNTLFGDLPGPVVYIQCSSCQTVLGAQLDPRVQARYVKAALAGS